MPTQTQVRAELYPRATARARSTPPLCQLSRSHSFVETRNVLNENTDLYIESDCTLNLAITGGPHSSLQIKMQPRETSRSRRGRGDGRGGGRGRGRGGGRGLRLISVYDAI